MNNDQEIGKTVGTIVGGLGLIAIGTFLGGWGTKKLKQGCDNLTDVVGGLFMGQNNAPQQIASGAAETVQTLADGSQHCFTETTAGVIDTCIKPSNTIV